MSISELISLVIAILSVPMTIAFYRNYLRDSLANYNHKEKVTLVTTIPSIALAFVLGCLAVLLLVISVPMLFNIQTLPVHPTSYALQDAAILSIFGGIVSSFLAYKILRVNWRELRIVLSPKTFG